MINQSTEVAVVGGGMVGGALALGLAQQGFSVTVIEQHAPPALTRRHNRMCVFRRLAPLP